MFQFVVAAIRMHFYTLGLLISVAHKDLHITSVPIEAYAPFLNHIPYYESALAVLISPTHISRHLGDYVDQCVCSNISKLLFI